MPAIEVHHLTKEYRLGALQSLNQTIRNVGARLLGRQMEEIPRFKALDDVSFTVEQGEVVGIIGHNGAGKSTLLKMLARISTPTSGTVKVKGLIAPLIEVGAGFVGDFTGRENVYLNGSILGMSRKEIRRKFDEIVDFAEMAEFIDTPIKRYSSGMQIKLAFAVATSVDSDILIVDEVLAVGDLAFQRKCFDRMEELIKRQGKTVLLVSHNIRQVERLCKRVIVMDHGRSVIDDSPQVACNYFYQQSDKKISQNIATTLAKAIRNVHSTGELELLEIQLLNRTGSAVESIPYGEPCRLRIKLLAGRSMQNVVFGIGIHTPDLLYVAIDDSILGPLGPQQIEKGEFSLDYAMEKMLLLHGTYAFRLGIASSDNDSVIYYAENLCHFQVAGDINRSRLSGQGFFRLSGEWEFASSSHVATAID